MEIIKSTLICFSKLCHDKNEKPYFYGAENSKLVNFFEKEIAKYPGKFIEDSRDIRGELGNMNCSRFIQSWGADHHPSFPPENLYKHYDEINNRDIFDKIALNFYNELGCIDSGKMRKDCVISE